MSQPGVGGTIWMARSSWQFLVGDCEQSHHGLHGAPWTVLRRFWSESRKPPDDSSCFRE